MQRREAMAKHVTRNRAVRGAIICTYTRRSMRVPGMQGCMRGLHTQKHQTRKRERETRTRARNQRQAMCECERMLLAQLHVTTQTHTSANERNRETTTQAAAVATMAAIVPPTLVRQVIRSNLPAPASAMRQADAEDNDGRV